MGAYILRRLLLVIPTLIGIMVINFVLVQFVPGGPIEQVLARLDGGGDSLQGFSGGGDAGMQDQGAGNEQYRGAQPANKTANTRARAACHPSSSPIWSGSSGLTSPPCNASST